MQDYVAASLVGTPVKGKQKTTAIIDRPEEPTDDPSNSLRKYGNSAPWLRPLDQTFFLRTPHPKYLDAIVKFPTASNGAWPRKSILNPALLIRGGFCRAFTLFRGL